METFLYQKLVLIVDVNHPWKLCQRNKIFQHLHISKNINVHSFWKFSLKLPFPLHRFIPFVFFFSSTVCSPISVEFLLPSSSDPFYDFRQLSQFFLRFWVNICWLLFVQVQVPKCQWKLSKFSSIFYWNLQFVAWADLRKFYDTHHVQVKFLQCR